MATSALRFAAVIGAACASTLVALHISAQGPAHRIGVAVGVAPGDIVDTDDGFRRGEPLEVRLLATVSWQELVEHEERVGATRGLQEREGDPSPVPMRVRGSAVGTGRGSVARGPIDRGRGSTTRQGQCTPCATPTLELERSFEALGDDDSVIPPDTMGAVGPAHVMTMLNSEVRIQDRQGGALSTVSLSTFWNPPGSQNARTPFDPALQYDSLDRRWIATADSDKRSSASRVLFAISAGEDPTGTWTFYEWDADGSNAAWADFPRMGFNAEWIAITNNMASVADDSFLGVSMWVLDKPDLLSGASQSAFTTVFNYVDGAPEWNTTGQLNTTGGPVDIDSSTLVPCRGLDRSSATLWCIEFNGFTNASGNRLLRLSRITRAPNGDPVWSAPEGLPQSATNDDTGFFAVENNFGFLVAPGDIALNVDATQAASPSCTDRIETNDPRMLDAVFRSGRVWCTHAAGRPATNPDRTAVFWYEINPSLMPSDPIVQSGFVDGAGTHHYYPSIAVNCASDMLMGFTRSSASLFAEGAFAYRLAADTPGSTRPVELLRVGEDSYCKPAPTDGRNRWGDYSATVVDPVDDLSFWTIQEYAAASDPVTGEGQWGTEWGYVQSNRLRCPDLQDKIVPADVALRTDFGHDVDIFEDTMVVGDSPGLVVSSKVDVYDRQMVGNSLEWVHTVTWVTPQAGPSGFGKSVAIDGDTAVIGSSAERFYIVTRNSAGQWPTPGPSNEFSVGASFNGNFVDVAIDGDTIVLGALADEMAFVYHKGMNGWAQEAQLVPTVPPGDNFDGFGESVSLSGDTVVVGAPGGVIQSTSGGVAFVFVRIEQAPPSPPIWVQQQRLDEFQDESHDPTTETFGFSVDIHGDTIVAGAPAFVNRGLGKVYVYSRVGSTWSKVTNLLANDEPPSLFPDADDQFGASVGVFANLITVGSPQDGEGAGFIFARCDQEWVQVARVVGDEDDAGSRQRFGESTAIDFDTAVFGAPDADEAATDIGAVYVYSNITPLDCDEDDVLDACQIALASPASLVDCNVNGKIDSCEIAEQVSKDRDMNGVPDECQEAACCFSCDSQGTPVVCVDGIRPPQCAAIAGVAAFPETTCASVVCDCVGDLDGDNDSDVIDFGIFAPNFGVQSGATHADGDMDCDGDVDVIDFGIFAGDQGCSGGGSRAAAGGYTRVPWMNVWLLVQGYGSLEHFADYLRANVDPEFQKAHIDALYQYLVERGVLPGP